MRGFHTPPRSVWAPASFTACGGLVEVVRVLRIDGAVAGHDQQPAVAECDAADLHAVAGEVGLDVHQLVRRLDGIDAVDIGQALQPVDHQLMALVAHDRVDRADVADDRLDAAAELADDGGELGDLGVRETVVFREDHDGGGLKQKSRPGLGGFFANWSWLRSGFA